MSFNYIDPHGNGEKYIFEQLRPQVGVVFDVGARDDSLFVEPDLEVHFFEPDPAVLEKLRARAPGQRKSFNPFGLGSQPGHLDYYSDTMSFVLREKSLPECSRIPDKIFEVRRADDYMYERGVSSVDFVKIDTEGFEMEVLRGFGTRLADVRFFQVEYGGAFKDRGISLHGLVEFMREGGFPLSFYLSAECLLPLNPEALRDHFNYCNLLFVREKDRGLVWPLTPEGRGI